MEERTLIINYSLHPKLQDVWLFDLMFDRTSYWKKLCKIVKFKSFMKNIY